MHSMRMHQMGMQPHNLFLPNHSTVVHNSSSNLPNYSPKMPNCSPEVPSPPQERRPQSKAEKGQVRQDAPASRGPCRRPGRSAWPAGGRPAAGRTPRPAAAPPPGRTPRPPPRRGPARCLRTVPEWLANRRRCMTALEQLLFETRECFQLELGGLHGVVNTVEFFPDVCRLWRQARLV